MSEVSDGTDILYSHIDELFRVDAIDVEEKQRLQDEVRILKEDIEAHYEEMADE